MAKTNINLLPQDLVGSASISKAAELLKRVAIGLAALFVILAGLGLALFLIFNSDLKRQQASVDSLRANIRNLEGVEQRLFLVKDRIQKASGVIKSRKIEEKTAALARVLAFMPSGMSLTEAELDVAKSKLAFSATDSSSLASFLAQLVSSGIYKEMTLKNFSFIPTSGFLVIIEAI
jgi:hypothetical protein